MTPILIFAGFRSYLNAQDARAERRNNLVEISDRAIDEVEQILSTVDTLQQIYEADILNGDCRGVFATLSPRVPQLSNIIFFNSDAGAECSALQATGARLVQVEAFELLRQGQTKVRTDAFFGPLSQAWLFSVMRRVEGPDGAFRGAIAFPLRTDELIRTIRLTNLPEDVELALSDSSGQVFGSARIANVDPDWISSATGDDDGELFVLNLDDQGSVDVVVRAIVDNRIYAVISRPSPGLFSEFTLRPLESIGIPLLSFTLALIAAWLAVDGLVLKWLARLRRLALIYGEGHYNFRIGNEFDNAPDEIQSFARTFDRMANRIAERDSSLRTAIATRDSAVKEIHHRVKNNLQIVASFLNLQRRQVSDPAARNVISAARHRIDALSIVHQTLYQHERLETVHMHPFLDALLSHLSGALGMDEIRVTIEQDIADIDRPADDAIPIALFLLEAVTNAMKYAFDENGGTILVKLQEDGEDIVLSVIDDGVGEQEQEDAPKSTGLGARLMTAFAKQLRAEMSSHSEPGEGYTVELRMPRSEREMKATDF
ncbi:sensor histidine kinase [Henriciella barbarensis]|uniref:sensor histidine kinase n=1 Tax=Henriciella barbarensis TaxID=86342 RepID=UPI0015FD4DA6|nr:histidine kinase dimerization/phosphoacceptor domain -containing protein [Henriciella barbarensis]